MAIYQVTLTNKQRIPIIAGDYRSAIDQRPMVSPGRPGKPLAQQRSAPKNKVWHFEQFSGVITDKFVRDNLNTLYDINVLSVTQDAWIPVQNVENILCLAPTATHEGAANAAVLLVDDPVQGSVAQPVSHLKGGTEANLFVVIPKIVTTDQDASYLFKYGVTSPAQYLICAHSFHFEEIGFQAQRAILGAPTRLQHHTNTKQGEFETIIRFEGYRGMQPWNILYDQDLIRLQYQPALIEGEGDYYLPMSKVSAIIRVSDDHYLQPGDLIPATGPGQAPVQANEGLSV